MRTIFLLFITLLITSACNNKIKEKIGLVTPGPNEYQVQRNKPLEVPPHYNLPVPSSEIGKTADNKKLSPKNLNEGEKALMQEIGG